MVVCSAGFYFLRMDHINSRRGAEPKHNQNNVLPEDAFIYQFYLLTTRGPKGTNLLQYHPSPLMPPNQSLNLGGRTHPKGF